MWENVGGTKERKGDDRHISTLVRAVVWEDSIPVSSHPNKSSWHDRNASLETELRITAFSPASHFNTHMNYQVLQACIALLPQVSYHV